jgi:hypothetical protein
MCKTLFEDTFIKEKFFRLLKPLFVRLDLKFDKSVYTTLENFFLQIFNLSVC